MYFRSLVALAIAISASASPFLGGSPAPTASATLGLDRDACPGYGGGDDSTVTVTVTVGGGGYGGSGSASTTVPIDVPTSVAIPTSAIPSVTSAFTSIVPTTTAPCGSSSSSGSGSGTGSGSGSSDPGSSGNATCNSSPVQCCNQIHSSNSVNFASILPSSLLGLLPIDLQGLNIPIGLDCAPIDVLGIGGNSCSQQTVCCENNNFSGLVAIGCTPININIVL